MTPDDIDATARRARAEAEAAAVLARAEIDADVVRASAAADAAAERARARIDAEAARRAADADREEAARVLEEARRHAEVILSEAADLRRRTEQDTLDRLRATRADLHSAIERLSEMTEPVLDLTDGTLELAEAAVLVDHDPDEVGADDTSPTGASGTGDADAVDGLVRSAIERAADSAVAVSATGRPQPWTSEQPSRRREQLRDGRGVL